VLLRDRRIGDEVGLPVDDPASEALLTAIDARQNTGGGEKLERAAHCKPLVAAVSDKLEARSIENCDAKPAAMSSLESCER
jgi:hypothetical protein